MSKQKQETPAVTLEQVEAEIAEHGEAAGNLTAIRDELLYGEQRAKLHALKAQQEQAVRGKDGARESLKKAKEKTAKSLERHQKVVDAEQQARRALSKAEFELRKVEHDIDLIERDLQSD